MQRTAHEVNIQVGDERVPIKLTDSAAEALQEEAAGKAIDAFAAVWEIEQTIEPGEGFASLELDALLGLRDHLQVARELVDVLIECRPLDEIEAEDAD